MGYKAQDESIKPIFFAIINACLMMNYCSMIMCDTVKLGLRDLSRDLHYFMSVISFIISQYLI